MQQLNPQDKSTLEKYTKVAKKIIYNPERMKKFLRMMGTKEGAVTAVQTVVAAIDKLKPIPPQILPMLAINAYMIMVDIAQDGTGTKASPQVLNEVIGLILQTAQSMTQQAPAQGPQGMLAKMQAQEPAASREPGDAPGPDETAMHEGAESRSVEMGEGEEEDGLLARMQRRGAPA